MSDESQGQPNELSAYPTHDEIAAEDLIGKEALAQLTPAQQKALDSLLGGASVSQCARTIGVGRSTIYRWLRENAEFRRVYTQWKEEMAVTARTRLLMTLDVATQNIENAINRGDMKISVRVAERMGVLAPPAIGPSNEELRSENLRLRNENQRQSNVTQAEMGKLLGGLGQ